MKFYLLIVFLLTSTLWANEHIAKITKLKGDVKCYLNPNLQPTEKQGIVNAKLGEKYYTFKSAEIGQEIKIGDRVETGAGQTIMLAVNT